MPEARQLGLGDVIVVVGVIVAVVLVAATVTFVVPGGPGMVFGTPLMIGVLIGGTALVLWRILRTPPTT